MLFKPNDARLSGVWPAFVQQQQDRLSLRGESNDNMAR